MSADPARDFLDARVLAWMREPAPSADESRFAALALELFAFQFAHCPPYARFCERLGRTPAQVRDWREIPAVPTGAFKETALRSFAPEDTVHVFRTSGTSTGRRGELHLDTLTLYEASLAWSFRRHVLPDLDALGGRIRMRILAPAPEALPDSSLSYMFGSVVARWGSEASGFDVRGGQLELAGLLAALEDAAREDEPVALCGTAFAFVHLLDALAERGARLALPAGSRVMETGGFKGRSRAASREELYAAMEERLGLPPDRVVNQYGMTELGSQFYDSVLLEPGAPRRKLAPSWTRVRILDPLCEREVGEGERGRIEILDLANTGSVLAVRTADLGRRLPGGFEVLEREPDAEARGCSIAADVMLSDAPA